MGKGSRIRNAKRDYEDEAVKALQNPHIRKAMYKEIGKQLVALHEDFIQNETAVILWVMHSVFGFGKDRLRKFHDGYGPICDELRQFYEMAPEDLNEFVCVGKLKNIGVDLEQWRKEEK